jgi:hypothetical protein
MESESSHLSMVNGQTYLLLTIDYELLTETVIYTERLV